MKRGSWGGGGKGGGEVPQSGTLREEKAANF